MRIHPSTQKKQLWKAEPMTRYNFRLASVGGGGGLVPREKGSPDGEAPRVLTKAVSTPELKLKRIKIKESRKQGGRPIPTRDALRKAAEAPAGGNLEGEEQAGRLALNARSTGDLRATENGMMDAGATPLRAPTTQNSKQLLFTIKEEVARDEVHTTLRRTSQIQPNDAQVKYITQQRQLAQNFLVNGKKKPSRPKVVVGIVPQAYGRQHVGEGAFEQASGAQRIVDGQSSPDQYQTQFSPGGQQAYLQEYEYKQIIEEEQTSSAVQFQAPGVIESLHPSEDVNRVYQQQMREKAGTMANVISLQLQRLQVEEKDFDKSQKLSSTSKSQNFPAKYFSKSQSSLMLRSKLTPLHQKLAYQTKLGELVGDSLEDRGSVGKSEGQMGLAGETSSSKEPSTGGAERPDGPKPPETTENKSPTEVSPSQQTLPQDQQWGTLNDRPNKDTPSMVGASSLRPILPRVAHMNKLRYVESSEQNLKDESLRPQTELNSMNEAKSSTFSSQMTPQRNKPSLSASLPESKIYQGKTKFKGQGIVQNIDSSGEVVQSKRGRSKADKPPESRSPSSWRRFEERKRNLKLDMKKLEVVALDPSPTRVGAQSLRHFCHEDKQNEVVEMAKDGLTRVRLPSNAYSYKGTSSSRRKAIGADRPRKKLAASLSNDSQTLAASRLAIGLAAPQQEMRRTFCKEKPARRTSVQDQPGLQRKDTMSSFSKVYQVGNPKQQRSSQSVAVDGSSKTPGSVSARSRMSFLSKATRMSKAVDPVLHENFKIQTEIAELRVAVEEGHDLCLNNVVQRLAPFVDFDMEINQAKLQQHVAKLIKQGQARQKEHQMLSKQQQMHHQTRKREGMFSHVQRIGSQNKRELRLKAQKMKLQQLEHDEKQAQSPGLKLEIQQQIVKLKQKQQNQRSIGKNQPAKDNVPTQSTRPLGDHNGEINELKQCLRIYKQMRDEYGRAFRVLMDSRREMMQKKKRERELKKESERLEMIKELNLKSLKPAGGQKRREEPGQQRKPGDAAMSDAEGDVAKRNEDERSLISQLMKRSVTSLDQESDQPPQVERLDVPGSRTKSDGSRGSARGNRFVLQPQQIEGQSGMDQSELAGVEKAPVHKELAEAGEAGQGAAKPAPKKHEAPRPREKSRFRRKRTDFWEGLEIEQRSLHASEGNSEEGVFDWNPHHHEQDQTKKLSKEEKRKMIMESINEQSGFFHEKMNKRLQDFDNLIPGCRQPKIVKEGEQKTRTSADIPSLRNFVKYLDQRLLNAKVKADQAQIEYLEQYLEYMNDLRDKIDEFTAREARKLKILQKFPEKGHHTEASAARGLEDTGSQWDSDRPATDQPPKFQYMPNEYLIFEDDPEVLKATSYQCKDADLRVLPLSQIYVLREEMSKQQLYQAESRRSAQQTKYLHPASAHQNSRKKESPDRAVARSSSRKFGVPRASPDRKLALGRALAQGGETDYEMMDQVLKKLIFFRSFGKPTRQKLYREFQYDFVYQNQQIFAQKDPNEAAQIGKDSCIESATGSPLQTQKVQKTPLFSSCSFQDKIFVIINGHASLFVNDSQKKIKHVHRTLFPGDSLGDGPFVLDAQKTQLFSLVAQTECDILSINKETFKNILIHDFTQIGDLKDKMKALKNQMIFGNVTNYALMILSNYIELREYHYGDIITHQDEKPEYFFIIQQGECKTVYETVLLKEKREYENPQPRKRSKKDVQGLRSSSIGNKIHDQEFKTGKIDYKKYSKPAGFEKKQKKMKIAAAAFLGKYQDSRNKIVDKKVIDVPRQRSSSQAIQPGKTQDLGQCGIGNLAETTKLNGADSSLLGTLHDVQLPKHARRDASESTLARRTGLPEELMAVTEESQQQKSYGSLPPIPPSILSQDKAKQYVGNVLPNNLNNGQQKISITMFENKPIKHSAQSNILREITGQPVGVNGRNEDGDQNEEIYFNKNMKMKKETAMKQVSRTVLNNMENFGEQYEANRNKIMQSLSQKNLNATSTGKPPLHPEATAQPSETAASRMFQRDMVAIRSQLQYVDSRIIMSAEGDRSTFDDFDHGMNTDNISGLGSSFCQRVLIQEDRLKKQIKKHFDFYLNVVGGWDHVNQVLYERQLEKAQQQMLKDISEQRVAQRKTIAPEKGEQQKTQLEQVDEVPRGDDSRSSNRASPGPVDEDDEDLNMRLNSGPRISTTSRMERIDGLDTFENKTGLERNARLGPPGLSPKKIQSQQSRKQNRGASMQGKDQILEATPAKHQMTSKTLKLNLFQENSEKNLEGQANQLKLQQEQSNQISSILRKSSNSRSKAGNAAKPSPLKKVQIEGNHQSGIEAVARKHTALNAQMVSMMEEMPETERKNMLTWQRGQTYDDGRDDDGNRLAQDDARSDLSDNFKALDEELLDQVLPIEGSQKSSYKLTKVAVGTDGSSNKRKPKEIFIDAADSSRASPFGSARKSASTIADERMMVPFVFQTNEMLMQKAHLNKQEHIAQKVQLGMRNAVMANKQLNLRARQKSFLGSVQLARRESASSFNDTTYIRDFKKRLQHNLGDGPELGAAQELAVATTAEESRDLYVDVIYDLLMRSQLTVVANSSKVRLICLPASCMEYLSEPVRKEIRQKILSLYIPIPEKKEKADDQEKKEDVQKGYNEAKLARELRKKEKERQARQLQFDKVIFKCKHAKVYTDPVKGFESVEAEPKLWKEPKFWTLDNDEDEHSSQPFLEEPKRPKVADSVLNKVQLHVKKRFNQSQSMGGPASAAFTIADSEMRASRNVSKYDDLVAPGDEDAEEHPEEEKEQSCDKFDELANIKENNQINPHRYNFLDLVDRPFCSEDDLQNFVKSNQKWIQIKDRIQRRDKGP